MNTLTGFKQVAQYEVKQLPTRLPFLAPPCSQRRRTTRSPEEPEKTAKEEVVLKQPLASFHLNA
ncbi:hypothetical protein G4O51_07925 [Candidatus Bathyarchaeota archaeon A05DMB-2]|nr:hypothetical protein [Candidatus Bathyarchaeota archaeon A05DMB-2]